MVRRQKGLWLARVEPSGVLRLQARWEEGGLIQIHFKSVSIIS